MADKTGASAKKTVKAKEVGDKKIKRGETVACHVCGLSVVVEQVGDVAVREESTLLCCGEPMKSKRAPAKAKRAA